MEPVYGTVIQLARLVWRVQGLKFTVTGVENLPATGGAVIAINHTSYFDFTFAGLPAYRQQPGRKVRFMAKKEVFDNKITGPIMRSLRHIEVDRDSGAASFERGLPGAQGRRARRRLSRGHDQPQLRDQGIQVGRGADGDRRGRADRAAHRVGRPAHLDQGPPEEHVAPEGAHLGRGRRADRADAARAELTALLHSRMQHLLERVQDAYGPHPPGEFWVPHRLGGGAPTLAEANRMDAEEAAEKAAAGPDAPREPDPPRRRSSADGAGLPHAGNRGQDGGAGPPGPGSPSRAWRTSPPPAALWSRSTTPATSTSLPAALAATARRRRLRFMIKAEMKEVKRRQLPDQAHRDHSGGPAGRRGRLCGRGGAAARPASSSACTRRPRSAAASSSRSSRPARPGWRCEAQVPIVPLIVWGAQRMWTKDHPKALGRNKFPIDVCGRRADPADGDREQLDAALREAMTAAAAPRAGRAIRTPRARTGCRAGSAAARRRRPRPGRSTRPNCAERARRQRAATPGVRDDLPALIATDVDGTLLDDDEKVTATHPGRGARRGRRGRAVRAGHRPPAALDRTRSSTSWGSRRWRCAPTAR